MTELKFVKLKKRTIVLITLGFIVGYIFIVNYSIKWTNNLNREYPELKTHESFHGVLQDHFVNCGGIYMIFEDSIKISLPSHASIDNHSIFLSDYIHYGDTLTKNAYSDTIYVYRDNSRYGFLPLGSW